MKICLLNVLHEADDKRVYHKIALSLLHAGHEIVSIVPDTGRWPEDIDGISFNPYPPAQSLWERFKSVFTLVGIGKHSKAQLYYAPEPESWVAALILKMMCGGKVVFDLHEHVPSEFAKFFPAVLRPSVSWLCLKFMRLFARNTDLILLTRDSFSTLFEGLKTPCVTVINTTHLQPACEEIPEALKAQYPKPLLIHEGIFGDVRGSEELLEAMKLLQENLPDLRCLLLGEYVYGDEAEYRKAIREAGLEDRLLLLPKVPFDDVPPFIALADIGLVLFQPGILNHILAMPHKLFDYMREGKPVIAPDFAVEVVKIVQEADCGLLVDTSTPEAIAGAVTTLLEDPEEARRLGENGRRAFEERYHWEVDEKILLDAVATLAGEE